MEELIGLATSIAMVVLGLIFVWGQYLARSQARRTRPIRARVLWAERRESGSRSYSWFVETLYDVPGHGELVHRRNFEEEGQALLWQRLHREGSEHDVVPNPREPGKAFLPDELKSVDWLLLAILGITSALAAWTGWVVLRDWVFE
jgi:hypothetical protein